MSRLISWRPLLTAALILPQIAAAHSDIDAFAPSSFAAPPATVECTLTDGTAASCYQITVGYKPESLQIGPFCPATLSDDGGIWDWDGENANLYRVNEAFLRMLDAQGYTFFDADGTVHVVDNAVERPTVDHACINVSEAPDVTITMLLPIDPVMAVQPTMLGTVGKVGIALDGVPIFSDAPSVQATGHMPALDTCGGHVDPGGWYHWHATATDIDTTFETAGVDASCALTQDSAAQFGYAFDGFALFGSAEFDGTSPTDLDTCNGHVSMTTVGEVYHYHATTDFPNLPPCLVGLQATDNFSTTATAGVGATRAGEDGRNEPPRPMDGGPGQMPPGFDNAATTLGVTTDALMQALRASGPGRPDLAVAAKTLGLSEDALRNALPPPPGQ